MTEPLTRFPRRSAITRRFTLGIPRSFVSVVTPNGPAVFCLRSKAGDDPLNQLLKLDPTTGDETVLVDPAALQVDDVMSDEERQQRERLREQAGGVTAYDIDRAATRIVFTLGGELFSLNAPFTTVTAHGVTGVFDARIAPDGEQVAFHRAGDVVVFAFTSGNETTVCHGLDTVSFGRAEFIAAEEMGRMRGLWWLPDSCTLLVTEVDETPVATWHISDPADPSRLSRPVRYPAAGTANATVKLRLVDVPTGTHRTVELPDGFPYLARVTVDVSGTVLLCQSRDQTAMAVCRLDAGTATLEVVRTVTNRPWVELVAGTPRVCDGQIVTVEDRHTTAGVTFRAVCVDGEVISPDDLYVRDVVAVDATTVTVHASRGDASVIAPYVIARDGSNTARPVVPAGANEPGVHSLVAPRDANGSWVHSITTMRSVTPTVTLTPTRDDHRQSTTVRVLAEDPGFLPRVTFLTLGPHNLPAALILPETADATTPLPVLLDPYGGPHAQRVLRHPGMFLTSAWFAAHGFAVLVIDGRGTPGRDPSFEYAIHHRFSLTVEDQRDGLRAAAEHEPRLDTSRVAIRGWSFGGYLAAYAALRYPDCFHVAVAGAPVTHWQWYDTHYTERYLGDPNVNRAPYDDANLLSAEMTVANAAPVTSRRPTKLLLIHGLQDDNVVAAHTLALSSALLAANRTHQVLPLSGVTHFTPQEQVAEALLHQQLTFLADALGVRVTSDGDR